MRPDTIWYQNFIYQKEDLYLRQISGNKLLVKALKEEGVDTLFGYPGACTIDISDELYRQSGIDIILPRHEQALVHEADAYARTTGKVGVCLVTSGPGATNLVTGVADAYLDGAPLVAITGQVGTDRMQLTSHQYLDLTAMFEPPISSPDLPLPTMTVFLLYVSQVRLPDT